MTFCVKWMLLLPAVLFGFCVAAAEQGNLLRHGAILTGSGFEAKINHYQVVLETANYFTAIADNDPGTGWRPLTGEGPHWLEMRWRTPLVIDRVRWEASALTSARLSFWKNGTWNTLARLDGNSGELRFPAVTTSRLRWEPESRTPERMMLLEFAALGPEQLLPPSRLPLEAASGVLLKNHASQAPVIAARPGDSVDLEFELTLDGNIADDPYVLVDLREKAPGDYFRHHFGDWEITATALPLTGIASVHKGRYRARIELPEYTPSGSVPVELIALTADGSRSIPIENPLVARLEVTRPESPFTGEATAPDVRLGTKGGQRGFRLGGERFELPFFFRYYCSADFERVFGTKASGIDIQYFILHANTLRQPQEWRAFFDRMDQEITSALRVRPESYFFIGMDMRVDAGYLAANSGEVMLDCDGRAVREHGNPVISYGSEKLLADALAYIDALLDYIASKPYAGRVIGFHPWSNTRLDAFIGGVEGNRGVNDRGKIRIGDFHPGVLKKFRQHLREKYGNDQEALRRAWGAPGVEFDTASPEGRKLAAEDRAGSVFRDPRTSRPEIDYIEFFPTLIGDFHRALAKRIKERTGGKALVMLHYGAILHDLAISQPSGARGHANNFDLSRLLADDNIDMYVQAMPYEFRHAGEPLIFFQPIESIGMNRRIFLADYDMRTVNCGTLLYGRHRSIAETKAIFYRDLGRLLTTNSGAWLADMSKFSWNEFTEARNPWFGVPHVTAPLRAINDLFQGAAATRERRSVAEIAVILSAGTPAWEDVMNAGGLYRNLAGRVLREELPRLAAPYDTILTTDLNNPAMKKDYKLYIFLNAFHLAPDEKRAIEALKRDGKTLLFFYAPGYVAESGLSASGVSDLLGIRVREKERAELMQMSPVAGSPLTDHLQYERFVANSWAGAVTLHPEVLRPVLYADDPAVQILGRYPDGKSAWVARDFGTHKIIYSAVPFLSVEAFRNIARYAGVNLYCDEDMVMSADSRFLIFTNGVERRRAIRVSLPRAMTVRDAFSGEVLCRNSRQFELWLGNPETRILTTETEVMP